MMDKERIIWLQREREAAPQTNIDAQRRLDAWRKKVAPYQTILNQLANKAIKATEPKNKVKLLREVADRLSWGWQGIAPCKDGCSHCCHMPTLLTQAEAQVIAQEVKVPIKVPKRFVMEPNMSYTGVPCPFLKDERCSIYRYRPFVCRLHVSLDRDDLLCNLASTAEQPQWDSVQFHLAELNAFTDGMTKQPNLADIREFFGEGE